MQNHQIQINELEILIWKLPNESIVRLFACDCIEHVLDIYEQSFPKDNRLREAMKIVREFALGQVSKEALINTSKILEEIAEEVGKLLMSKKSNNKIIAAKAVAFGAVFASLPDGVKVSPILRLLTPSITNLKPEIVWSAIYAADSAAIARGFIESQINGKSNLDAQIKERKWQILRLLSYLRLNNE